MGGGRSEGAKLNPLCAATAAKQKSLLLPSTFHLPPTTLSPEKAHLLSLLEQLLESEGQLRHSLAKDVALEILVLRLCEQRERVSLETILKKLLS